jgi:hypothetical protein
MKRWLGWVIITCVIAIVFVGFGVTKSIETKREFNSALQQTKKEVKKEKYAQAQAILEDALRRNQNNPQGNEYLQQVQLYRSALDNITQKNYQQAKEQMSQVAQFDEGFLVLIRRASQQQAELKEVIKELAIFNKAYTKAKQLTKSSQYTASNTKLAVILDYGSINKSYYDEIRIKAKKLQAKNNKILKSLGYTVDEENKPTDDEIKAAKQQLTKQGVDVTKLTTKDWQAVLKLAKQKKLSLKEAYESYHDKEESSK